MEEIGAMCELGNYYSMCSEEADFMAQLLANCNHNEPADETSNLLFPFPTHQDHLMSMDYFWSMENSRHVNDDDDDDVVKKKLQEHHVVVVPEQSKKRSRIPAGDIPPPVPIRNKREDLSLSKRPKVDDDDDDDDNINANAAAAVVNHNRRRSSRHMISCEDAAADSTSSSSVGVATPKTRAGRGSATDPQSLYARKRRERINERLKILQKLVPNGTKVDISTMLEEAVEYVKFLQLQIKLLSSDDLWMYAPIAYNGMDIAALH